MWDADTFVVACVLVLSRECLPKASWPRLGARSGRRKGAPCNASRVPRHALHGSRRQRAPASRHGQGFPRVDPPWSGVRRCGHVRTFSSQGRDVVPGQIPMMTKRDYEKAAATIRATEDPAKRIRLGLLGGSSEASRPALRGAAAPGMRAVRPSRIPDPGGRGYELGRQPSGRSRRGGPSDR